MGHREARHAARADADVEVVERDECLRELLRRLDADDGAHVNETDGDREGADDRVRGEAWEPALRGLRLGLCVADLLGHLRRVQAHRDPCAQTHGAAELPRLERRRRWKDKPVR